VRRGFGEILDQRSGAPRIPAHEALRLPAPSCLTRSESDSTPTPGLEILSARGRPATRTQSAYQLPEQQAHGDEEQHEHTDRRPS
jgi:hypothetical protein